MEELTKFWRESIEYLNYVILGVPLYKLVLAVFVLFLSFFIRKLFILIIVRAVQRLAKRTATQLDDILIRITYKPISFLIVILGVYIFLWIIGIEHTVISKVLRTLFIITISWMLYNIIISLSPYIYEFSEKFGKELANEIGNFILKFSKISIIILAILAVLQDWGINVSAVLASLGLGGLAFALAAKDTVANLFGGLTVLLDKSMKIGDWIKIGDVEGIVEDIGLRSTKIRSFEKSLIILPNQALANQSLENFSKRNVRRIKMIIGVTYSTTREQMVKILKDIRTMLKNHPGIAKDQLLMVYFRDFGPSSLDIFIYCFTNTANWQEYLAIREDVNLKIMEIIEKNGASFAFPSTSIYIEKLPDMKFKKKSLKKEEI